MSEALSLYERMTTAIAEKLEDAAAWVSSGRAAGFDANPKDAPTPEAVSAIIGKFVAANTAVVAGANLVPGPLGALTLVPELGIVLRNQLAMIHDIGYAYGRRNRLNSTMLLGVLALATGSGAGYFIIKGQQVVVKQASLRVLQKIVQALAGKITQRVLKQLIIKWAPFVGAAVLAAWAGISTKQIGEKARDFFSKDIVDEDETAPTVGPVDASQEAEEEGDSKVEAAEVMRRHATCLVNLIGVDGVRHEAEIAFLRAFVSDAGLAADVAERLMSRAETGRRFPVNLAPFKLNAELGEALLVDLVALAQRDGEVHAAEKVYIHEVGRDLGYDADEIERLFEAAARS